MPRFSIKASIVQDIMSILQPTEIEDIRTDIQQAVMARKSTTQLYRCLYYWTCRQLAGEVGTASARSNTDAQVKAGDYNFLV